MLLKQMVRLLVSILRPIRLIVVGFQMVMLLI